jgi:alkaline phosphatase D
MSATPSKENSSTHPSDQPDEPDDPSRRRLVIGAGSALALGASLGLAGCGGGAPGDSGEDRFGYGVASGDPLSDRVILWTRVNNLSAPAQVNWELASDAAFVNIVRSGTAATDASRY